MVCHKLTFLLVRVITRREMLGAFINFCAVIPDART